MVLGFQGVWVVLGGFWGGLMFWVLGGCRFGGPHVEGFYVTVFSLASIETDLKPLTTEGPGTHKSQGST